MLDISEIKRRADIEEVWTALGGGKLRGNRGQAFWRDGTGYNVALDLAKGLWYEHRDGTGGDVVALVEVARGCTFGQALQWLADFTGTSTSPEQGRRQHVDTDWPADLRWARWWRTAAEIMAEQALEELPDWHPERRSLTELLQTIRLGDAALVAEYRAWRRRNPEMTAALAQAGRQHDARIQRRLAHWLVKSNGETAA